MCINCLFWSYLKFKLEAVRRSIFFLFLKAELFFLFLFFLSKLFLWLYLERLEFADMLAIKVVISSFQRDCFNAVAPVN